MCGRGYSRRRWDKRPVTAGEARGGPDGPPRLGKPDPDHRVVSGAVIACAGIEGLGPGASAEIEFARDAVTVWYADADEQLVDHGLSYDSVDFLRVTGRGAIATTTGGGLGGLGLSAGLPGLPIASLINSITRKTETSIETFVHLKARRTELLLLETTTPPRILSVRLGPAFDLIDAAHQRKTSTQAEHESTVADQLVKLSELLGAGLLTAEEFAVAKRRLLGT
jgi:hypothetical protein